MLTVSLGSQLVAFPAERLQQYPPGHTLSGAEVYKYYTACAPLTIGTESTTLAVGVITYKRCASCTAYTNDARGVVPCGEFACAVGRILVRIDGMPTIRSLDSADLAGVDFIGVVVGTATRDTSVLFTVCVGGLCWVDTPPPVVSFKNVDLRIRQVEFGTRGRSIIRIVGRAIQSD
jgi:hypothetical protein